MINTGPSMPNEFLSGNDDWMYLPTGFADDPAPQGPSGSGSTRPFHPKPPAPPKKPLHPLPVSAITLAAITAGSGNTTATKTS